MMAGCQPHLMSGDNSSLTEEFEHQASKKV